MVEEGFHKLACLPKSRLPWRITSLILGTPRLLLTPSGAPKERQQPWQGWEATIRLRDWGKAQDK